MDNSIYIMKFKIVKQDERYTVEDDTSLNDLIVSRTTLHPDKSTTGHSHKGQEEVYIFQFGMGVMEIDNRLVDVEEDSIVLIKDGEFHRVHNTGKGNLIFVCVFKGERHG